MHLFWSDLLSPGVPLLEKAVRTLIVYLFLLGGLRLAGKRELGQFNPFDLVVLLLLSNTVQNAIIGNDDSLLGGLFGALVLLVFNGLVVRYLYRHPQLDEVVEGDPEVLIDGGTIQPTALAKNLITLPELEAAARRQGIERLEQVQCCRLEVGGALTFVEKAPSSDEQRHTELLERLERLERMVRDLGGGGPAAATS